MRKNFFGSFREKIDINSSKIYVKIQKISEIFKICWKIFFLSKIRKHNQGLINFALILELLTKFKRAYDLTKNARIFIKIH